VRLLQGTVAPVDAEEAARQFWNRKTNLSDALEQQSASLDQRKIKYSDALKPTVDALDTICEHVVESMAGV
jgi:hypothetical protein